jgi:hypothetical protein
MNKRDAIEILRRMKLISVRAASFTLRCSALLRAAKRGRTATSTS